MRKAILVSRNSVGNWSHWKPVFVLSETENTWRVWSWSSPFTKLVHKRSMGLRVEER